MEADEYVPGVDHAVLIGIPKITMAAESAAPTVWVVLKAMRLERYTGGSYTRSLVVSHCKASLSFSAVNPSALHVAFPEPAIIYIPYSCYPIDFLTQFEVIILV